MAGVFRWLSIFENGWRPVDVGPLSKNVIVYVLKQKFMDANRVTPKKFFLRGLFRILCHYQIPTSRVD